MNFVSNAKIATIPQVKVAELTQNSENMRFYFKYLFNNSCNRAHSMYAASIL